MIYPINIITDPVKALLSSIEFSRKEKRETILELSESLKSINVCINNIIEFLQKGEAAPQDLISELNEHIQRISTPFKKTSIGKEVEQISQALNQFTNHPAEQSDIEELKTLSGRIRALSQPIYISLQEKKLGSYIGRRKILLGFLFTGTLASSLIYHKQRKEINEKDKNIKNLLTIKDDFPDNIKWDMKTFLGKEYESQILYYPPYDVAKLVSQMTNNRFTIDISEDISIVDHKTVSLAILEQLNSNHNNFHSAYSGVYYDIDNISLPLFFSSAIPFGLTPQEKIAWLNYKTPESEKEGLTYVQLLYRKKYPNIYTLPVACTGMQMGGWFKKKIETISDFRGLKMRIPGIGKHILAEFGVESVPDCFDTSVTGCINEAVDIPGHRIRENLLNGRLDAAEWIGPHDDIKFDIPSLSNTSNHFWYYYFPAWWEPSTTFSIHINKSSWDELPNTYKSIFESACSRVFYDQKPNIDLIGELTLPYRLFLTAKSESTSQQFERKVQ